MPMKIVVDVEHTVTLIDKSKDKYDLSPYCATNKLVSVGWSMIDDGGKIGPVEYVFFHHNERLTPEAHVKLQEALDRAEVFIAHNAKHDYNWLRECGFRLPEKIYCTFIGEYVLARGQYAELSLDATCKRYSVTNKKGDLVDKYIDDGIMFDAIPADVVEEYGRADVQGCAEVYAMQQAVYSSVRDKVLVPTRDMSMEFCRVLCDMERNGVRIDVEELNRVQKEYETERDRLRIELDEMAKEVMGDFPYNLNSPEQVSAIIFSVQVEDKAAWKEAFNIGRDVRGKPLRRPKLSPAQFKAEIKRLTKPVYRAKAHQCEVCKGSGKVTKIKKDGTEFKKPNICSACSGRGFKYTPTTTRAGFGLFPQDVSWVTVGGFATDKDSLGLLLEQARIDGNQPAVDFIGRIVRLSAVEVYISSFCEGIRRGLQSDSILHAKFNQCITATGRLSSTDPNLQNQPRGQTFPIRGCFRSRWENAMLCDTDFSQLEFRAAAHLARDERAKADILAGLDIHNQTAKILTEAGQATERQAAKAHSFKPLYGGMSGTEAEMTYYKSFLEIYSGIGEWHNVLQDEAIEKKCVTLPTGRQYAFPFVERNKWGNATQKTQIVNYPVQGFATADIVPIAIIVLWQAFRKHNLKSLLVLTVHDSVVVDVFPGEEEKVKALMSRLHEMAEWGLKKYHNITMFVPLATETKIGPNLLKMEKVS